MKLHIKPGASGKNKDDYSHSTLVSQNFGELLPHDVIHGLPGQEIVIKSAETFARLAPMPLPTYTPPGTKFNVDVFKVEYPQVWSYFREFAENIQPTSNEAYCKKPTIPLGMINVLFSGNIGSEIYWGNGTQKIADKVELTYSASWKQSYSVNYGTVISFDKTSIKPNETFDFYSTRHTQPSGSDDMQFYPDQLQQYTFTNQQGPNTLTANCLLPQWGIKLTPYGYRMYKVLRMLGYDFAQLQPYDILDTDLSNYDVKFNSHDVDLLPLVALASVHYYYYESNVFKNANSVRKVLNEIYAEYNLNNDNWNHLAWYDAYGTARTRFKTLLRNITKIMWSKNIFTQAWKWPTSPDNVTSINAEPLRLEGLVDIADSNPKSNDYPHIGIGSSVYSGTNGHAMLGPDDVDDFNSQIQTSWNSSRWHDWVQAFGKLLNRYNVVGVDAYDRLLSKFGVRSPYRSSRQPYHIKSHSFELQIGDVTNTSANSMQDIPLGDYSGKGFVTGGPFSCKVHFDDFGIVFILGHIEVKPVMYQGIDPHLSQVNSLDMYQPDFDGVGVRGVPLYEYVNNPKAICFGENLNLTFGYIPRYQELHECRSKIVGDYLRYPDMSSWHLGRDISSVVNEGNIIRAQDDAVVYQPQDNSQFNRIFFDQNPDVDHFYFVTYFDVDSYSPVKSDEVQYQLQPGDTDVKLNGN